MGHGIGPTLLGQMKSFTSHPAQFPLPPSSFLLIGLTVTAHESLLFELQYIFGNSRRLQLLPLLNLIESLYLRVPFQNTNYSQSFQVLVPFLLLPSVLQLKLTYIPHFLHSRYSCRVTFARSLFYCVCCFDFCIVLYCIVFSLFKTSAASFSFNQHKLMVLLHFPPNVKLVSTPFLDRP